MLFRSLSGVLDLRGGWAGDSAASEPAAGDGGFGGGGGSARRGLKFRTKESAIQCNFAEIRSVVCVLCWESLESGFPEAGKSV